MAEGIYRLTDEEAKKLANLPAITPPINAQGVATPERLQELNKIAEQKQHADSKVELLEQWHNRKNSQPWTVDEIAELIVEAANIGEEIGERHERERIITLLHNLTYIDEDGDEMVSEFTKDLADRIRAGE
jgi:hypothetical protein